MITGNVFRDAIISGANNICAQKQALNDLNIFPVPDGDTGTNMSMTISAAAKELKKIQDAPISGNNITVIKKQVYGDGGLPRYMGSYAMNQSGSGISLIDSNISSLGSVSTPYYQDNGNRPAAAPRAAPRGRFDISFYAQQRHLTKHPQHKLVSMLNSPHGKKHINSRADNIERNEKVKYTSTGLNIFKELINESSKLGRNNGKVEESN